MVSASEPRRLECDAVILALLSYMLSHDGGSSPASSSTLKLTGYVEVYPRQASLLLLRTNVFPEEIWGEKMWVPGIEPTKTKRNVFPPNDASYLE